MVVEVRFVRKYVSSDICVEQFPLGTLLSGCDIRAVYTAPPLRNQGCCFGNRLFRYPCGVADGVVRGSVQPQRIALGRLLSWLTITFRVISLSQRALPMGCWMLL
jgi:hypothetical protein